MGLYIPCPNVSNSVSFLLLDGLVCLPSPCCWEAPGFTWRWSVTTSFLTRIQENFNFCSNKTDHWMENKSDSGVNASGPLWSPYYWSPVMFVLLQNCTCYCVACIMTFWPPLPAVKEPHLCYFRSFCFIWKPRGVISERRRLLLNNRKLLIGFEPDK